MPYVFAEAYDRLAAEQVRTQGGVIKAELDELYEGLVDPDVLGLDEALAETWWALIEHKLVE